MTVISVIPPFINFADTEGDPLESGYIYIGTAGQNPLIVGNQVAVYADSNLTIPIAQPIRTIGGYPVNSGTPAQIFVGLNDYSIVVLDKHSELVYSSAFNKIKLGVIDLSTDVTGLLSWIFVKIDTTSAETSALITPTNYFYQPGDVRRYGAVGNDVVDCTTAFQSAIAQQGQSSGSPVFIPEGTFKISIALTGVRSLVMNGASKERSIVHLSGAISFLTYAGVLGAPDGGGMLFSDFCVKGSATALDHFQLSSCGQSTFRRMKFWLTNGSFVNFDTLNFNITFNDCLFQSWKTSAVFTNGLNSLLAFRNCEFSIVGADGITPTVAVGACVSLGDGELITFDTCNVNGDSSLPYFLRFRAGVARLHVKNCYTEFLTGSSIRGEAACLVSGMMIDGSNFSTADSVSIDISAGNPAHTGVVIRNVRRPETGAVYVFSPGTGILDFDYAGVPLDGAADHVFGFTGLRAVRKYIGGRIDRNGQMSSVNGISATTTPANNLRQNSSFAAATTKVIAFAVAEPDANFFVFINFTSDPGAGRMWVSGKSTAGFTVNYSVATSATFDWMILR